MSKRKLDISDFDVNELIKNNNYKLYNYYNNPTNCDVITLCDNHIYFNACINYQPHNQDVNNYDQLSNR